MPDLKPCPCCGGEARHYFSNANGMHLSNVGGVLCGCNLDHHVILCYKCGLRTKVYATAKGCYKAWHRRAGEEAKPADVATVRRGRWIEPSRLYYGTKQYECSLCYSDTFWKKHSITEKYPHCPNCGALMDGGETNATLD